MVWAALKWPFSKPKPTRLAPDTIEQIKPPQVWDGPALTVPEFIRLRREFEADAPKSPIPLFTCRFATPAPPLRAPRATFR